LIPLYAIPPSPQPAAQPEAVPVGWFESPHGAFRANPDYQFKGPSSLLHWRVPLYLVPPSPQPLTDGQIETILMYFACGHDWFTFARTIERAHGIGTAQGTKP
jgi:hypothetical protein